MLTLSRASFILSADSPARHINYSAQWKVNVMIHSILSVCTGSCLFLNYIILTWSMFQESEETRVFFL